MAAPMRSTATRFSIKHQAMAAAGYAVLFCNPAGSTGYGEAFTDALHDRFPGPDWDDLEAAMEVVAARPDIDADNLFVSGQSGGGVLTLWAVAHSHRFRGAVAIKPVVDWSSWVLGSDIGASIGLRWMGGALPWDAPEKYRARSPVTYAPQVRTPTLLMAGEADSRTPMSETLQMYAALRLAGVDAHLLRFPGATAQLERHAPVAVRGRDRRHHRLVRAATPPPGMTFASPILSSNREPAMRRRTLLAATAAPLLGALPARPSRRDRRARCASCRNPTCRPSTRCGASPIVSVTHGYMVWDTLFGLDHKLEPQPQMCERAEVSADGLDLDLRAAPRPGVPRRRAGAPGRLHRFAAALHAEGPVHADARRARDRASSRSTTGAGP